MTKIIKKKKILRRAGMIIERHIVLPNETIIGLLSYHNPNDYPVEITTKILKMKNK